MIRHPAGMAQARDVILEFYRIGGYVKVSAIDSATGTEAAIVGDPAAGEAALKQAAIRKLEYVLAKADRAARRRA